MKTFLLLLAVAAAANAQSEAWCRCAAFITYNRNEMMVHEAPEIPINSCDDANQCKQKCVAEINEVSYDGDLWHMLEDGYTVGQHVCTELADRFVFFVVGHKVYGYYEVCGGAWQYTGVASTTKLCCNGGQHSHCLD
ncbi:uncharacterized protein LOC123501806 [Portunus trituberculatus]|uniref:uncharacterized protein LOC123501806 n=1 Tax=Portunus trituberculatus TaxID=210409 RepID=UPI001E1CDF97|nr:uncharacterized protein LOC123501806 [Portunus trituberculatus]